MQLYVVDQDLIVDAITIIKKQAPLTVILLPSLLDGIDACACNTDVLT